MCGGHARGGIQSGVYPMFVTHTHSHTHTPLPRITIPPPPPPPLRHPPSVRVSLSGRPGSAGERPRTALAPSRPSLERQWEAFCERSGLAAAGGASSRASPARRTSMEDMEASASSGLTHGSSIVFAGNPVTSIRRRSKAPAVVREPAPSSRTPAHPRSHTTLTHPHPPPTHTQAHARTRTHTHTPITRMHTNPASGDGRAPCSACLQASSPPVHQSLWSRPVVQARITLCSPPPPFFAFPVGARRPWSWRV